MAEAVIGGAIARRAGQRDHSRAAVTAASDVGVHKRHEKRQPIWKAC